MQLPLDVLREIALRCDGKRLIQLEASDRALWRSPVLENAWKRAFAAEYGADEAFAGGAVLERKSWREAYLIRKTADWNRANGIFVESSIGVVPGGCPPICCLIQGDDLFVAAQGRVDSHIQDFEIQVWNLSENRLVHTLQTGWEDTSPMANMSILGTHLVVGRENGQVALWQSPRFGASSVSDGEKELEWSSLFNKNFTGACGINGTSVCCTDLSLLCTNQLVSGNSRSQRKMESSGIRKAAVVMIVQRIAAYWVVLLSHRGEVLSSVLLETPSLLFCRSCGILRFGHATNLDMEMRMRMGSWESLGSMPSNSKFWELASKHSHKVSKQSWIMDRFQNPHSPFRVIRRFFLQDGFLIRYAIFPRMGPSHLNLRVVWGEPPRCDCIHLEEDREPCKNMLEHAGRTCTSSWCFDLLPGEECVDARSNGTGGHVILTRSLDAGRTLAGIFRMWHAQTASIVGVFDMFAFMQSDILRNNMCETTNNLLRRHFFHSEGRFLVGTGNEVLAVLELNGCHYSNSVEVLKMVGFWNLAKNECISLSLGNGRRVWCNWKWLVFEKQDAGGVCSIGAHNYAHKPQC